MTLNRPIRIVLALLLLPAAVACQRGNDPVPATTDPGPAAAAAPEPSAPAAAAEAPVSLDDVIETDPRYVVGISYPPGAAADPGLAQAPGCGGGDGGCSSCGSCGAPPEAGTEKPVAMPARRGPAP